MTFHDTVIVRVVETDLCIEVASADLDVTLRNFIHDGVQLPAKILLIV